MVAIIKNSRHLRNALRYNEKKLEEGKAALIHAEGFLKDADRLNFKDKIKRFEKLTQLNDNVKINSVHISLNFHPSEKFTKETLQQIAETYMQKIGFGDQPYLLYQHNDAGHPHLHIVTTNMKRDGSRIELHNLAVNESKQATKEIEKAFNLVVAQSHQQKEVDKLTTRHAVKVQYGRTETLRAMTAVLDTVVDNYTFSSLTELNAILKQYHMTADPGSPDSRIFKYGGLVYRVLDEKGQKIGVPVKASDFPGKPTIKCLKEKFRKNEPLKEPHKLRVQNAINLVFRKNPAISLQELVEALKKEKIHMAFNHSDKGTLNEVIYVDHQNKCVFSSSDLDQSSGHKQMQVLIGKEEKNKTQAQKTKQDTAILVPDEKKQQRKQMPEHTSKYKIDGRGISRKESIQFQDKPARLSPGLLQLQDQGSLNSALSNEQKKKRRKKLRH